MASWPSPRELELDRDVLVPLLLAAFVIVAASFLSTVVLDMEQSGSDGQMADASVEFREDAGAVFVKYTAMARPGTALAVSLENVSSDTTVATARLTTVGQIHVFGNLVAGHTYEVVVVAEWRDRRSLVLRETGSV